MLNLFLLPAALAVLAYAAPTESPLPPLRPRVATPQVVSATYLGNATDPNIDRDSCGSSRIGGRAFWTCRDSQKWNSTTGRGQLPVIVNTAAWSPLGSGIIKIGAAGAASSGTQPILNLYGPITEYFPLTSDMCPSNHGFCSDGTRWANWPNSPPLVVNPNSRLRVYGYSWIAKSHLMGLNLKNPATPFILYRSTYNPGGDPNAMPAIKIVNQAFWAAGELGYGDYGNVISNGYAYLYAQIDNGVGPALARVKLGNIENRSKYQYYVNGAWTSTLPSPSDPTIIIPNAGDGWQGTYYYSTFYSCFVWIGQKANQPVAWFYMSTAPAPEGPWAPMYLIFQGANGDGFVGAYSLQAHPALGASGTGGESGVYVTWTQVWNPNTWDSYTTPLVYLQFG